MKRNRIVVGMSGGPDSMALAHQLHQQNYEIICAHVDYQKRESSQRDRKIVEDFAHKYNLALEVRYFDADASGNFQAKARSFRYDFFVELVEKYKADAIAIAHHLNDDVETYVFQNERKMRSDTKGLAEQSFYQDTLVIRPLLDQSKKELLEYCEKYGIVYGLDESNTSLNYTRNAIRHRLDNMSASEYHKLYEEVLADKEKWRLYINEVKSKVSKWGDSVTLSEFIGVDDPTLHLRYWMTHEGVEMGEVSEAYLSEVVRVFGTGVHSSYQFGEYDLSVSYGVINISKNKTMEIQLDSIEYLKYGDVTFKKNGQTIEGVQLFEEDFPITLRYARNDDEIQLRFGRKKLNRFFIDRKIPLHLRKKWVVIENSAKQIVFVVGIGCDVHHYANNPNLFVVK